MNKKRCFVLLFFSTIFFIFLLYSGIFSFHGLCGCRAVGLNQQKSKGWPCKCIGVQQEIGNSYEETTFCTGINLSYNILNNSFKSNSQVPVYSRKPLYMLEVTSLTIPISSEQSVLSNISIDVLSTEGVLVKSGITSVDGKVNFILPKGDYKVKSSGGYTGTKEVSLDSDTSIELRLLPISN